MNAWTFRSTFRHKTKCKCLTAADNKLLMFHLSEPYDAMKLMSQQTFALTVEHESTRIEVRGQEANKKLSSPILTGNNVEATLSNATSRTILSTKSNVASTLLRFWQQCRPKFRLFDKVETNRTCSICFDFVF